MGDFYTPKRGYLAGLKVDPGTAKCTALADGEYRGTAEDHGATYDYALAAKGNPDDSFVAGEKLDAGGQSVISVSSNVKGKPIDSGTEETSEKGRKLLKACQATPR